LYVALSTGELVRLIVFTSGLLLGFVDGRVGLATIMANRTTTGAGLQVRNTRTRTSGRHENARLSQGACAALSDQLR
jgi:hypothetical protein